MQNEAVRQSVAKLLGGDARSYVCDVEHEDQIARLREELAQRGEKFHGLVHSIAFADYSEGVKPFHETPKKAFLQAVDISCFSLIATVQRVEGPAGPGRLGGDDFDFHHADGQRELRLHGPDQGGVGLVAGVSWPSRSAVSRGFVSTPWRRAC